MFGEFASKRNFKHDSCHVVCAIQYLHWMSSVLTFSKILDKAQIFCQGQPVNTDYIPHVLFYHIGLDDTHENYYNNSLVKSLTCRSFGLDPRGGIYERVLWRTSHLKYYVEIPRPRSGESSRI